MYAWRSELGIISTPEKRGDASPENIGNTRPTKRAGARPRKRLDACRTQTLDRYSAILATQKLFELGSRNDYSWDAEISTSPADSKFGDLVRVDY